MFSSALLWLFAIVIGVMIAVAAFKIVFASKDDAAEMPYAAKRLLLSPAEKEFFLVLKKSVGEEYEIFSKVRLWDLAQVKAGVSGGARQAAENRVKSKHVDFVLCRTNDFGVAAAVELDDSSHRTERGVERDNFVDAVFATIRTPLIHFPVQRSYDVAAVKSKITQAVGSTGRL